MHLVPLKTEPETSVLEEEGVMHTKNADDKVPHHHEHENHQHKHHKHDQKPNDTNSNNGTNTYEKYTCPMHPQIMSDVPGKCPLCGMTLVPLTKPAEGSVHASHSSGIADFRKRFIVVFILTFPIMLLSDMIQTWLHIQFSFPGDQYILFALSSVVFFYGGWPFLKGLVGEISVKNPGMMTLIGFAISVAYIYSVAVVFGLMGMDFFWELTT